MLYCDHRAAWRNNERSWVLILIVMDVVLWFLESNMKCFQQTCLNPYCNGCCIVILYYVRIYRGRTRLNPYCNGCCIVIPIITTLGWRCLVLILIVMDVVLWWDVHRTAQSVSYRLNPYCNGCCIVIEVKVTAKKLTLSLNPYCNGCCIVIIEMGWIAEAE